VRSHDTADAAACSSSKRCWCGLVSSGMSLPSAIRRCSSTADQLVAHRSGRLGGVLLRFRTVNPGTRRRRAYRPLPRLDRARNATVSRRSSRSVPAAAESPAFPPPGGRLRLLHDAHGLREADRQLALRDSRPAVARWTSCRRSLGVGLEVDFIAVAIAGPLLLQYPVIAVLSLDASPVVAHRLGDGTDGPGDFAGRTRVRTASGRARSAPPAPDGSARHCGGDQPCEKSAAPGSNACLHVQL